MNDTLYHYIDPGFSHTQVGNYTLLLLLNAQSFELAVMHGQKLMVWRKAAPLAEITQPGEVQEVLSFSFHDIITGINTPYFTLVPQTLFEKDQVTEVARYLDVQATDTVFAQVLDANNQVVFKTQEALTLAAGKFDLQKVTFGSAGWILAIEANMPSNYSLYVNLHATTFDIAYFRHGKLHLYNTFEFTHEDELAYYNAFVCQQLKLDMSLTTVILSGEIMAGDNRYHNILSNFFKTVELNTISVAELPASLPNHQLLALTSLSLCASLADA
ncbi:DUF3822 family protein [Mucilaginibacter sp. PAMB04274]|uniref:DUF3822 family protein n=1 Tax=Mucilaginibacter sp. PAMB04274 TaxID=3138568 RepID=UPI0031F698E2